MCNFENMKFKPFLFIATIIVFTVSCNSFDNGKGDVNSKVENYGKTKQLAQFIKLKSSDNNNTELDLTFKVVYQIENRDFENSFLDSSLFKQPLITASSRIIGQYSEDQIISSQRREIEKKFKQELSKYFSSNSIKDTLQVKLIYVELMDVDY